MKILQVFQGCRGVYIESFGKLLSETRECHPFLLARHVHASPSMCSPTLSIIERMKRLLTQKLFVLLSLLCLALPLFAQKIATKDERSFTFKPDEAFHSIVPERWKTPINKNLLNDPAKLSALLANISLKRLGTRMT